MAIWQDKWAVVTGASAGIGWHLAEQLAAARANLVLVARRIDRLEQLALQLRQQHGVQVEICSADLTDPRAPQQIFDFTRQHNLPIDILINNAGFGVYGEFSKSDLRRVLDMVQVNVTAVVHLTHLYLPAMIQRRSGYVMIVSSTAAFQPVGYLSGYAGTKGFELLFGEGVAEELRSTGVHISVLCPGPTATEFNQAAGEPERSRRRETPGKSRPRRSGSPRRRQTQRNFRQGKLVEDGGATGHTAPHRRTRHRQNVRPHRQNKRPIAAMPIEAVILSDGCGLYLQPAERSEESLVSVSLG